MRIWLKIYMRDNSLNQRVALAYACHFVLGNHHGTNEIIQGWYRDPTTLLVHVKDSSKLIEEFLNQAYLITLYVGKFKSTSKKVLHMPLCLNRLSIPIENNLPYFLHHPSI